MNTILIIAITVGISLLCFSRQEVFDSLKFSAYGIWHRRQ